MGTYRGLDEDTVRAKWMNLRHHPWATADYRAHEGVEAKGCDSPTWIYRCEYCKEELTTYMTAENPVRLYACSNPDCNVLRVLCGGEPLAERHE